MFKEGTLNLNAEGVILRFGNSLEDILGYGSEELVGKDFSCLAPRGAEAFFKTLLNAVNESGVYTSREVRMLRKDGTTVDLFLSAYPLRDRTGDLYSFMIVLTTQMGPEVPGILSEEFQRVFRFSNDAVAITDREGSIMDVNQAFLDTYGYRREDVLGKNPRILKSRHSTGEMYEKMWRDILDPRKNFWRGEIINVRKDGTEVPVVLSINAIKGSDGEIKNFLGIGYNMSEKKEMERTNRMYIDHVVHDLRGPLTTIMANSELLMAQIQGLTEKSRKKLDAIFQSSQKLNAMTGDILDYSRAQSGGLTLRKEKVDLTKVFREAAMPFETSGKKLLLNGSEYGEDFSVDSAVNADAGKLQRIIYNLLNNAFKHAATEVRVSMEFPDGGLKVTVSDDGGGFSAQDAERIFDAYYQTESGVKTGGAVLGLSIAKCFVEAHGGRLWADGGKGATFGFFMPG
ncbi:MAG: PAS domain-containing sensor histidine kinase [Deltaproteobacteria bacterium]|nr:PAS domain-containing sensor histidine kinase [Deltaproteobacteria bacterium]